VHDCGWLLATLRGEGVRDWRVLEAMRRVPRERFVPSDMLGRAYENEALPVGDGQTISQPYVVARMTEALALKGTEHVHKKHKSIKARRREWYRRPIENTRKLGSSLQVYEASESKEWGLVNTIKAYQRS